MDVLDKMIENIESKKNLIVSEQSCVRDTQTMNTDSHIEPNNAVTFSYNTLVCTNSTAQHFTLGIVCSRKPQNLCAT